jgi:sRNA-binding regulator protein Hfq
VRLVTVQKSLSIAENESVTIANLLLRMSSNGYLQGLKVYLAAHDANSVFTDLLASGQVCDFHVHPGRVIRARVTHVEPYQVTLAPEEGEPETLDKHNIHFLSAAEDAANVAKLVKADKSVQSQNLEPSLSYKCRHLIKNKTLFPLMEERAVLFFTLIDGSVIRGLVVGFSRYEIQVSMKGGTLVTLFRHSVYDLRDKDGVCYLKSVQEKRKDWKKSSSYKKVG